MLGHCLVDKIRIYVFNLTHIYVSCLLESVLALAFVLELNIFFIFVLINKSN